MFSIETLPGLSQAFLSSLHTSPFEQFTLVLTPPEQTRYPVVLCGSAKVPLSSGHSVLSGKDHQKYMKNFHPSRNVINVLIPLNLLLDMVPSSFEQNGTTHGASKQQTPCHQISYFYTLLEFT